MLSDIWKPPAWTDIWGVTNANVCHECARGTAMQVSLMYILGVAVSRHHGITTTFMFLLALATDQAQLARNPTIFYQHAWGTDTWNIEQRLATLFFRLLFR